MYVESLFFSEDKGRGVDGREKRGGWGEWCQGEEGGREIDYLVKIKNYTKCRVVLDFQNNLWSTEKSKFHPVAITLTYWAIFVIIDEATSYMIN